MNVIKEFLNDITDGAINEIETKKQKDSDGKQAVESKNAQSNNEFQKVATKFENIASGIVAAFVILVVIMAIFGQKSPSLLFKGGNIMDVIGALLCTVVEVVCAFLSMIFFVKGTVHVVLSAFCEPYAEALADNSERLNLDLKKAQNRNDASTTTRLQPQASKISVDANIMARRTISHKKQIFPNYMYSIICGLLAGATVLVYTWVMMNVGTAAVPTSPSTHSTLYDMGTIISLW